ncbi:MAG: hypothetical protein ACE5HE_10670 [Phycisphaerae bacterium]
MRTEPKQADVSTLATLVSDLATVVAADCADLQRVVGELSVPDGPGGAERLSMIICDLQASFRALSEASLRFRALTMKLRHPPRLDPGAGPSAR